MGKKYSDELKFIPEAILWAMTESVLMLERSLSRIADKNLLVVGSGGSSTVAAFIASLHEAKFERMARSTTPGEFVAGARLLESCTTMLVSAEGKNKDVLAATDTLIALELPGIALTLNSSNPLAIKFREHSLLTLAAFPMPWEKDGYLATNSLVATMVLAARAYKIGNLDYLKHIDSKWLATRRATIESQCIGSFVSGERPIVVLHGGIGKIGAIDIESKLAEAALRPCSVTDYRQFAHGRHLQMAEADRRPSCVAFYNNGTRDLCDSTLALFPRETTVLRLELPNDPVIAEVIAVIDALLLTEIFSNISGVDPGQPLVPNYGRSLHSLDLQALIPLLPNGSPFIERKVRASSEEGAKRPWADSLKSIADRLARTRISALVFDFDGTFCETDLRFEGLDSRLISEIERLAGEGIVLGFASGRGDSLYLDLRNKLNPKIWPKIIVGYYSGSLISHLSQQEFEEPIADPRFEILEAQLVELGVLGEYDSKCHKKGGQMSLRLGAHSSKEKMLAAIWNWISTHGYIGWRAYCSGHSIDVLTENVGKELVASRVAALASCRSDQVMRIGDSGGVEGNDFELLSCGLGLSVQQVSGDRNTCWNFLPRGQAGVEGTLYYLSALVKSEEGVKFSDEFISSVREAGLEKKGKK